MTNYATKICAEKSQGKASISSQWAITYDATGAGMYSTAIIALRYNELGKKQPGWVTGLIHLVMIHDRVSGRTWK